MKTQKTILAVMVGLSLGLVSMAHASIPMNKYADYKAQVEATKGTTASEVAQHSGKFCRENMERHGMGGTIFPSVGESGGAGTAANKYLLMKP